MKTLGRFVFNLLLSIDQYANVLLLGDPDETISGRTGRAMLSGRPKWFVPYAHKAINKLFNILDGQQNHCIDSVEPEETYDKELWSWIKNG
jgi:hypothetical protein